MAKERSVVAEAIAAITGAITGPRVKVSLTSYASCYLFSTSPMRCPGCGVTVPANTQHRCEKKS